MRSQRNHMPPAPAKGQPGEIVTARVGNPLENARCSGKARPVILVRREGCNWRVMGLTSKSIYRDGTPRSPVPNPAAVGLSNNRASYLWADHLTRVSVLDIDKHIGWVDGDLAVMVAELADLPRCDAKQLFASDGRSV